MKKYKYDYVIGIDTGVNTGFAVWCTLNKSFLGVSTYKIHKALLEALKYSNNYKVLVRVEDARLRKWVPKTSGRERLQGAGSIKRDAKIWEDFLTEYNIDFELVAPKNNKTKLSNPNFKALTGWTGRTNEHSRDAGALVFQYNGPRACDCITQAQKNTVGETVKIWKGVTIDRLT